MIGKFSKTDAIRVHQYQPQGQNRPVLATTTAEAPRSDAIRQRGRWLLISIADSEIIPLLFIAFVVFYGRYEQHERTSSGRYESF